MSNALFFFSSAAKSCSAEGIVDICNSKHVKWSALSSRYTLLGYKIEATEIIYPTSCDVLYSLYSFDSE